MAVEIHQYTATIPANTAQDAPVTIGIALDYFDIESIDLEVPPGPAGLMGFYIARSGQQVIPFETGEWIVWDDRFDSWPLTDQPTSSGWQVVGYNLDDYDHDIVLRFHVNLVQPSSIAPPTVVFASSPSPQPAVVL